MELLPYYSELKLAGHLACAFVSAILCGTLMALACVSIGKARLFDRAYCFALMSSAVIWVVPMLVNVSAQARELMAYAAGLISLLLVKWAFESGLKESIWHIAAFCAGNGAVFFMAYKQVF